MALNLLFSIFGGFSIFVGVSALTNSLVFRRRRSILEDDPSPGKRQSFFDGLRTLLYQARAPIRVGEFIMISALIGALISLGFFFATGAMFVAALLFPVGGVLYYLYLTGRRDAAAMEYEKAQPQVAYVLSGAFRSGGLDVDKAIALVLTNGPEIVNEDWVRIRAAISSAEPDYAQINQTLGDRNSPGLWKLVEAILQFRDEPERIPPSIDGLRERIIQEVTLARENLSMLKSGRRQLMIMSALPPALMLFFTLASPEFRIFYSSFIGQIVMLMVFGLSLGIYMFGARLAAHASLVRPYRAEFAQERKGRSYLHPKLDAQLTPRSAEPLSAAEQAGPVLMTEPHDKEEIEEDPDRPEVPGRGTANTPPLSDYMDE